jgi:hypothetical protein
MKVAGSTRPVVGGNENPGGSHHDGQSSASSVGFNHTGHAEHEGDTGADRNAAGYKTSALSRDRERGG